MKLSKPLLSKAREKRRLALLQRAQKAAHQDQDLAAVTEQLRKLWLAAYEAVRIEDLARAERADKGEVLWEIFFPRTKTPLNCSMFNLQRVVTRTPNRILVTGLFFTIEDEWKATTEDAWPQLSRMLGEPPFDLAAFRHYAHDIDELLRREARRETFVVTDDNGNKHEVRCESANDAKDRVGRILGSPKYVVGCEAKEAA